MSAFTGVSPARLATKVGRLAPLKPSVLDRVRHEALTVPSEWVAGYDEYQSGGWQTVSLYNDTRDPTDVTIRDCDAVETSLLRHMPTTRALLRGLGLRYMWVRIARLRPNSFLWEHRDYGELSDRERHRLHIPLVTNISAYLVTGGARVHLCAGSIWRIVPTDPHGVCNLFGPDRVHLILDCYGDDAFAQLADRPQLTETDVTLLPEASDEDLEVALEEAATLARLGYLKAAEQSLLRLFYSYALPEGCVYDLIMRMYASLDRTREAEAWRGTKHVVLGLC